MSHRERAKPDHRQVYAEGADDYERLVEREDYQGNLVSALEPLLEAARAQIMVELGAGTGRLTRLLAPRLSSVKAFDASEAMLRVARRKLHELGIENCSLATADNAELPVEDGCADLVVAGWAIGHTVGWHPETWRSRVERVLGEMGRVARPSGLQVIFETLGTGHRIPTPPPHLVPYYELLEERGFVRQVVRTDYRFASAEEAEELVGFFFGEQLAAQVRESGERTLPECTGLWSRAAPG